MQVSYCYFSFISGLVNAINYDFAVYPELLSKNDDFLFYGISIPMSLWGVGQVLIVYSLYYDWTVVPFIAGSLQILCFIVAVAATFRWIYLVTKTQRVGRFDVSLLTLEEFTFFLHWIPSLLYAPLPTLWGFITGDVLWKTHTVENLIFIMSCHVLSGAVIIGLLYKYIFEYSYCYYYYHYYSYYYYHYYCYFYHYY